MRLISVDDRGLTSLEESWVRSYKIELGYVLQLQPNTGWFGFDRQGAPINTDWRFWKWASISRYFK